MNEGNQQREGLPVSNGEENSGTGGFVIGNRVVVEETADEFVDYETTDDLHPHPYFFPWEEISKTLGK